MRAERGYTTSVVILRGQDAAANEEMFKQRSHTDYILLSLPVWPEGLAINSVQLTTRAHLGDMLNALRGKVSTLSVDFHEKQEESRGKRSFLLVTNGEEWRSWITQTQNFVRHKMVADIKYT